MREHFGETQWSGRTGWWKISSGFLRLSLGFLITDPHDASGSEDRLHRGLFFILVIAAILLADGYIFFSVGVTGHVGSTPVVSNTGAWLAAFFIILFDVSIVSIFMAVATYRAKTDSSRRRWSTVWNIAELLWVCGALFSVVGALKPAEALVGPAIAQLMAQETTERRRDIAATAEELYATVCDRASIKDGCAILDQARSPDRQHDVGIDLQGLYALSRSLDAQQGASKRVAQLAYDLASVNMDEPLERFEGIPLRLPDWFNGLLLFVPHILAFVFPLKFGRAMVGFRA